jgi:GH25 family lysozyme M1 (1,4-beta-N-acetylmuramidase)
MATTIFEDLVNLGFKIFGYDASRFNDNPDTEKLPDLITSMKFGFAFAGFRGGLGVVVDSLFQYYWKACKGLCPRLVYWYLDYYSHINMKMGIDGIEWGKRQARAAWESHKTDPGELPLYLDIENATNKLLAQPITSANVGKVMQIARAFLEEYDRLSGGFAGMYFSIGNINWFGDWFKNRPVWLAWYDQRALNADAIFKKLNAAKWRELDDVIVQFMSSGDINKDGKGDGKAMGFEEPYLDINYYLGNGKPTTEQWSKFIGQNSGIPEIDVITPEDEPVIPEEPDGESTWQVLAVKLNMRVKPDKTSKSLGYYLAGAPVVVDQLIGNWGHVSGQQYFICIKDAGTVLAIKNNL